MKATPWHDPCLRRLGVVAFCSLVLLAARPGGSTTNEIPFVPPCRALVAAAIANHFPPLGFDGPIDTNALTSGDSATILATQFERGGRRDQWVILLQVVAPTERERGSKPAPPKSIYTSLGHQLDFASARTLVSVRTIGPFEAAGSDRHPPRAEDESARIALDTGFLSLGFDRAAAAGHRVVQIGGETKLEGTFDVGYKPFTKAQIAEGEKYQARYRITPEEEGAMAGVSAALEGFFGLAAQTPALNKILFKLLNAPSAWSLLSEGHLPNVTIQTGLYEATPDDPRKWHLTADSPLYDLPWMVMINQHPGLYLDAMVTTPHPPFLITGGVVYLRAVNPTEQEKCLTLYLLGARRGVSPASEAVDAPPGAARPSSAGATSKPRSACDHIVMIGASVTHGFTAAEPLGGLETAQYDLSRYLDAALQLPHRPITNFGNSLFFMQVDSLGEQQIQMALDAKPTLVVGIDFLFWFCYGKGFDEPGRLQHLDQGLQSLEAIHCPLIIGDIPDVSAAANGILSTEEMPSSETLAAANRRLKEWAAKHPAVVVVPLAKFIKTAMADQTLAVHNFILPAGKTRALMQNDKLHPTARGCAVLALAILDAFQASRPDLDKRDVRWNAETVLRTGRESPQNEAVGESPDK